MSEALLEKHGIDPDLPIEQLLEQLQSKNLELLERMDSCSDNARLAQLQADQREVEDFLSILSSAVSLDRQVAKKAAQPSPAASADPLQAALQDYQEGKIGAALPVLREHADQGDTLCCILTANILMNQHQTQEGKEYLYAASAAGSGTASLMLAQTYQHDNVLPSAIKWGKLALEQKEKGSGRFLAPLYLQNNQPDQAAEAYIGELGLVSQYDLYLLTHDIVALLNKDCLSPAAAKRLREETLARIQNDSRCMDYWQEQKRARDFQEKEAMRTPIFDRRVRIRAGVVTLIGVVISLYRGRHFLPSTFTTVFAVFTVLFTIYRFATAGRTQRRRVLVIGAIKVVAALIIFGMIYPPICTALLVNGSETFFIIVSAFAPMLIGLFLFR